MLSLTIRGYLVVACQICEFREILKCLPVRTTVPAEAVVVERCHGQLVADLFGQQTPEIASDVKTTARLANKTSERRHVTISRRPCPVSTYRRLRAHLLATRASWCRTDAALNLNTHVDLHECIVSICMIFNCAFKPGHPSAWTVGVGLNPSGSHNLKKSEVICRAVEQF